MAETKQSELYGLMAEFDAPEQLIEASRKAYEAGFRQMDAYTPFPVEGLPEAVGFKKSKLPLIVLIGALVGGTLGFAMQYFASVIHYPLNIGGRPLNSWPSFLPITFEMTILVAAFSAVLGMFALNGLPQPYHPVFNVPRFALASRDRFFLCIESEDEKFDPEETKKFLESLQPKDVFEVDP
ncbi:MAG: DUF3341 domain-containing protein [Calditrichaeota bacterium]|nr:DUF3341 domain-containing protein [Calditrichota bacterium]